MATQVIDASSLTSSEDAFKTYQLPTIRRLEQQLRRNINDNREKLRSLVGASYRDLLGTAERIIEMDGQVQEVDSNLSIVGRNCNSRAVERSVENYERMRRITISGKNEGRKRILAQTKVLQNALTVTGRIITAEGGMGDALLASKLLVLARLLHKSVSESEEPPALLENLRRKLTNLRRKLLGYIDKSLATSKQDRDARVHTLCAYAMVTSSAPKDVLRHFLQVRHRQIESLCETSPTEEQVLESMDVFSQTIVDTREIFPRRFSDASSALGKAPLLQDKSFMSVPELSLDIYLQWLAEDVRTFTPWVRHDQLLSSTVSEGLSSWSKSAETCVLDSLKMYLSDQTEALEIVVSRQRVLSKYLALRSKLRLEGQTAISLQELRNVFLTRLEVLASFTTERPELLESSSKTPGSVVNGNTTGFWDIASRDIDLSSGAMELRSLVRKQRFGRDNTIGAQVEVLEQWLALQESFWNCTKEMRAQKWDDDLDYDLDNDDDETTDADSLQTMLSVQDCEKIRKKHHESVAVAVAAMFKRIAEAAEAEASPVLIIRMLRALDIVKRDVCFLLGSSVDADPEPSLIMQVFNKAAEEIVSSRVPNFCKRYCDSSYTPKILWDDGDPSLPVQPSPATFRLLKLIHADMSDAGVDLWSPGAVRRLKAKLDQELGKQLADGILEITDPTVPMTNGQSATADNKGSGEEPQESKNEAYEESRKLQLTQRLFDLLYLRRISSTSKLTDSEQGIGLLIDRLSEHLDLGTAANDRLSKSAGDYWNRTYLLFGLLAPHTKIS